jgi:hypothetical protein
VGIKYGIDEELQANSGWGTVIGYLNRTDKVLYRQRGKTGFGDVRIDGPER